MGVLGTIVKAAFSVNQKLHPSEGPATEEQETQLINLLKAACDTSFGKYYGFSEILKSDDIKKAFAEQVPIHEYSDIKFWWDQQQKYPDITWPGQPDYFALTSGTTGSSSKRVPVTNDFLESMRKGGVSLARSLPNFDLPEEVFESRVLMLGSSSDLEEHEYGHLEGEISGINVSNFPDWYELFYAPGLDIAKIDDWDKRLERIIERAPEWDIGSIAGIPSWILQMLKAVIEHHELEYIQDIWPKFRVFVSGGVAFDTYEKDFAKISKYDLTIIDTFLASEGFFAHTSRPGTLAMEMVMSSGYYYEFIPFDERGVDDQGQLLDNPEVLTLSEVEEGQEYALVVSTCAGAWRYVIGDTIKFTDLAKYEIVITGRMKFFLNVVGSQLSEEKLDAGILDVAEALDVSINEYMVAALKDEDDEYYHHWCIVSDDEVDEQKAADVLDESLQEMNKNYKVEREKALSKVEVKCITKSTYNAYLEDKKKKGGQVKTPKVMKAEQMQELLEFIEKS